MHLFFCRCGCQKIEREVVASVSEFETEPIVQRNIWCPLIYEDVNYSAPQSPGEGGWLGEKWMQRLRTGNRELNNAIIVHLFRYCVQQYKVFDVNTTTPRVNQEMTDFFWKFWIIMVQT